MTIGDELRRMPSETKQLIDSRLAKVSGARRHIAERIFDAVPANGTSIGNQRLRTKNKMKSSNDYLPARDELVAAGLLRLGYGRGGSVRRHEDVATDTGAVEPDRPSAGIELSLYADVADRLRQQYEDDRKRWTAGSVVETTGNQGGKKTGGKWTRPDITVVAHRTLEVLAGTHIEVHTYELKTSAGFGVDALHEARSHRRCVHRSYVLVDTESAEHRDQVAAMIDQARDLGVGLISFEQADAEWDVWLEAPFHQPDPVDLDDFLANQLSDSGKATVRSWQATPGLSGE